jgi:hypothetical protein
MATILFTGPFNITKTVNIDNQHLPLICKAYGVENTDDEGNVLTEAEKVEAVFGRMVIHLKQRIIRRRKKDLQQNADDVIEVL